MRGCCLCSVGRTATKQFRWKFLVHETRHAGLTNSFAYSTDDAPVKQASESFSEENSISLLTYKKSLEKKFPLKIKRSPFMKNLFHGKFDTDILAFPEIFQNKEIDAINKMADTVRTYIMANVDSERIDKERSMPSSALQSLKRMGLFGSRVPQEYGGLGATATEHVRFMEACSLDSSLAAILNTHHSIAAQTLLYDASDALRNKYLPKVASGELLAALCVSEINSGSDVSSINSVAKKNHEKSLYYLNGKKIWVTNGENADLFVVLAKNLDPELPESENGNYITFIIEKDFPGVRIGQADDKMGLKGVNTCSIEFHETPVPLENVIGASDKGFEVVSNISFMNRFHIGAFCSGLSKALIELSTDHCINRYQFASPLMEFQNVKDRIGKLMCRIYAMESVVYLTAGLFDSTQDPDLNLEYSAVNVYCTENLWFCANEVFKLVGSRAYLSGHPVERAIRDSRAWWLLDGTNDILRQFIALSGLSHVGNDIAGNIEKLRNPLFNPILGFKRLWSNIRHEKNYLSLKMDLAGFLHPTLKVQAENLEYSVQTFHHSFETLLTRTGRNVLESQVNLGRLADMAIEIYVMAAVLSRASRSYCIGLPCNKMEVTLAYAYCEQAHQRITKLKNDMALGTYATSDEDYQEIARELFRKQGYCVTPPYTRNF